MSNHIKPYLSYSQYTCFLQSPEEYKRRYIDGVKYTSKYMEFGKMIAEISENRKKENPNTNEKLALELLPVFEETEKKLEAVWNGVPLLGYLDGYNKGEIIEIKTGTQPWTQKRVDEHEQLDFYAIMLKETEKIKIEDIKIKLIWLETMVDVDGTIFLTGKKEQFETKRTLRNEIYLAPKVKKVWKGIDELIKSII